MAGKKSGGSHTRSAISGRFVPSGQGKASPNTTVCETTTGSNSGGHYRSAISGRYVTTAHGKASPHTTVRES